MFDLLKELRQATRRLVRSPAFTIAAALTLALGIAANASIFTVVNRVILRPLPYPDADRLIWVDHVAPGIDLPGSPGLSQGLYRFYRERVRSFTDLAIFRPDEFTMTGPGAPQRLRALASTASLRDALGTPPALGRWYTEKEAQDEARVVVISHALWTTQFGRDPAIVGRSIRLNGTPREIVGVMPASFAFPNPRIQVFVPERITERQAQQVGGFNYQSVARLSTAASRADVKREMDALIATLKEVFSNDPVAQQALDAARLAGAPALLKDRVIGPVKRTLWTLLGMVGLVLLIACANVANLFLVRSEERNREVAVRRALGAGHGGIVRYYLTESVLLATAAGALGLLGARVSVQLLARFGPENLPRLNEVAIDGGTLAWTGLLALSSSLVFGAIPLFRRATALAGTLREGGRSASAGRARFHARNLLMGGQVALALVLLVASGLMLRSFLHLRAVNPGFTAENLLTFDVMLTRADFADRAGALRFHEELLERIRALPGVQSAGAVNCLPLTGGCWGDPLLVRGRTVEPGQLPPMAQLRRTLPGFFQAMNVPLLRGRVHEPADHQQRTGALVLSQRAASLYFPDEDPIGKYMTYMFQDGSQPDWYPVVGVVGDMPVETIGETPYAVVYFSAVDPGAERGVGLHNMAFAVRTTVPPMGLAAAVRGAAAQLNPNVALGSVRSMEMIVNDALARTAFTMLILLVAGAIAMLLGAVGIYGVISYVVSQRTNEIGVRMALGARPRDVALMVLRQSGAVVGAGLVIGLAGASALSRFMRSLLFQVTPTDVTTYITVSAFLLTIALFASWVPARRAAALDPLTALRRE